MMALCARYAGRQSRFLSLIKTAGAARGGAVAVYGEAAELIEALDQEAKAPALYTNYESVLSSLEDRQAVIVLDLEANAAAVGTVVQSLRRIEPAASVLVIGGESVRDISEALLAGAEAHFSSHLSSDSSFLQALESVWGRTDKWRAKLKRAGHETIAPRITGCSELRIDSRDPFSKVSMNSQLKRAFTNV
jgi:DNA-binding NarL/FixJ family response regulator